MNLRYAWREREREPLGACRCTYTVRRKADGECTILDKGGWHCILFFFIFFFFFFRLFDRTGECLTWREQSWGLRRGVLLGLEGGGRGKIDRAWID